MFPISILHRKFSTNSQLFLKHIAIIGSGKMGTGIAQLIAQNGIEVTLVEQNKKLLQKAEEEIVINTRKAAIELYKNPRDQDLYMVNTLSKIHGNPSLVLATRDADIIIEAITENMSEKQKLFSELDPRVPEETIFVTNTSSCSVKDLASVVNRKDRFAGLHFFNPAYMMKLVEIVRIPETSDQTYMKLMEFSRDIGKTCITCKDTPGFVVNRLLLLYIGEAIRMFERGDASIEIIDEAMKLGAGYRTGPFELVDAMGLDTFSNLLSNCYENCEEDKFKPIELVQKLVTEGKLGKKSGEGFYKYNVE